MFQASLVHLECHHGLSYIVKVSRRFLNLHIWSSKGCDKYIVPCLHHWRISQKFFQLRKTKTKTKNKTKNPPCSIYIALSYTKLLVTINLLTISSQYFGYSWLSYQCSHIGYSFSAFFSSRSIVYNLSALNSSPSKRLNSLVVYLLKDCF